jgi:hypothetical protein
MSVKKDTGKLNSFKKNLFSFFKKIKNNKKKTHRSFNLTKRRDYIRKVEIPGSLSLNLRVFKIIKKNIKTFLLLAAVYAILSGIFIGMSSQDAFNTLTSILNKSSGTIFSGNFGAIGKAGLIMLSSLFGSTSGTLTQSQQIFVFIFALMVWLTTVWLTRNYLANKKVKLRDGLYNSGAPIIATAIVAFLAIVQFIPVLIAAVAYSAANSTGLISGGGAPAMLFWFAELGLVILTLYFLTSTLIALVIVTIPGMYPFKAIHIANDIVSGIRTKILMRLLGLIITNAIVWSVIEIIVILLTTLLNNAIKASSSWPIIPISILIMTVITVIWTAVYVYVLYRKVVDGDVKSKNN